MKKKSKEDMCMDAFFWPTMTRDSVTGKVDNKNLPHISQHYIVPIPCSYTFSNSNNDLAVYSMWEHFLDFLKSDYLSVVMIPRRTSLPNPYSAINTHTGRRRLPCFQALSQERSISPTPEY